MYKQVARRDETKHRVHSVVVHGCRDIQADSGRPRVDQCWSSVCRMGTVEDLTQLEGAAESQTSGPMRLAILLRNSPERDLPGDWSHPKRSGLDTTQALVSRTAWREIQGAGIVTTDTHPA